MVVTVMDTLEKNVPKEIIRVRILSFVEKYECEAFGPWIFWVQFSEAFL
jgi:hypothetical protein